MDRNIAFRALVFLLTGATFLSTRAETFFTAHYCDKAAAFAENQEQESGRKYAPSRQVEILHQRLEVTPDFERHGLAGVIRIAFKPITKPFSELRLDAVDLAISQVEASAEILGWQNNGEELVITFKQSIGTEVESWVKVAYQVEEPKQGLYFRTPSMGYPSGDTHLWTQGEMHEARHWFPSCDYPNQKFTTEMICHVKAGMVALSNGKLVSQTPNPATGLVAWHWQQEKPHANYLISLCAGYFSKIQDRAGPVPLAFWTPASQIAFAKNAFAGTRDMVDFFEKETGVKYPWDRYDQVVVDDFTWGGMENTSQTTLVARGTLFPDEFAGTRGQSCSSLIAHELAHQWFGDYVTTKDWSHVWLNEGFATYYDALYHEHSEGRDEFLYHMLKNARSVLSQADDVIPVVYRGYKDPVEQFGTRAYQKGSWILHMLRNQLGPEMYRKCIQTHLETHAFGNATTEEFVTMLERLTGQEWDQFFDQYVFHAHHPELKVSYRWDERTRLATVAIDQVQKLGPTVLLFKLPLKIRFKQGTTTTDVIAKVSKASEEFTFPLPARPEIVRVDPDFGWLAQVDFPLTSEMIRAQLADPSDVIGRIRAVEQLGKRTDKGAVEQLQRVLNQDPFWGVRAEAAEKLREIHSDDSWAALLASLPQTDERVRRVVVAGLAGFFRPEVPEAMAKILENEKNPDIKAIAVRALAPYPVAQVREQLIRHLNSDSYEQTLAVAAVSAIRGQRSPVYVEALMKRLREGESQFPTSGFTAGMTTLALLAAEQENRAPVREFITSKLNHPKRGVQTGAIRALGELGDPQAIAALETIANAGKTSPNRTAAEESIRKLRERKPQSAEVGSLRKEVLDLQTSNREIKQQFEDLKKRLDSEPTGKKNQNAATTSRKPAAGRSRW